MQDASYILFGLHHNFRCFGMNRYYQSDS